METLDIPFATQDFIDRIQSIQNMVLISKVTGHRIVTLNDSNYTQFCVKVY